MIILAFWSVNNDYFERYAFDGVPHEDAFRELWEHREAIDAKFYDVESFIGKDANGLSRYMSNADDLEEDYNDELLDGGHWMESLNIPADAVAKIVGATRERTIRAILALCRERIDNYETRVQLALDRVDIDRCPLSQADPYLYGRVDDIIEEYGEDNGVDTEHIYADEIIWED